MTTDTRQQLYNRIRSSSLDEVVLEEMIRHGFWPSDQEKPTLPEVFIKRRGELQREITQLARQAADADGVERAVRMIMKERMRAARERRVETKKRQAQQRYERALAWHEKKRNDIVHLGEHVSAALGNGEANVARLQANGLPEFSSMNAIADAMGIELGELHFLAYNRKVSKVAHYKRFQIPKKTGGFRTVSAPMPRLKRAQYWLLEAILSKMVPHDAAHGFRAGRSILTNAAPHAAKSIVVNFDLKDFFPSISYRRVKGLFVALGYCEAHAAVFALLATDAPQSQLQIDGEIWNVAEGDRVLPQGAPTSPAITNLLCRKLDRRLTGAAQKYGFDYTRYADDLTFSATENDPQALNRLIKIVRFIVSDEGFSLNERKTRVMRKGQRQDVTGLTVNDGISVSRRERRRFRAYLHQNRDVSEPAPWRRGAARGSALGYAQFLTMVQGDRAAHLAELARSIFGAGVGPSTRHRSELGRVALREAAGAGKTPRDQWWRPASKPSPGLPDILKEPEAKPAQPAAAATSVPNIPAVARAQQTPPSSGARAPQSQYGRAGGSSFGQSLIAALQRRRIRLTFLAILLAISVPGTIPISIAVIYFAWFYRRM